MHRKLILPLSALSLALAGCGADSGGDQDAADLILGGELAMAATPDATEAAETSVIDLMPADLAKRLEAGNVQLIDVRTAEEFAEGHIEGAINIAVDDFDPAALPDADGKDVILYCRSGRRSGIAGEKLAAHTGKAAEHLGGGIIAWRDAELPTVN